MSGYKDASPSKGGSPKGPGVGPGMKNVDGREMGSSYSKNEKPVLNAKLAFSPNEDAPQINGGTNRVGLEGDESVTVPL